MAGQFTTIIGHIMEAFPFSLGGTTCRDTQIAGEVQDIALA